MASIILHKLTWPRFQQYKEDKDTQKYTNFTRFSETS